MSSSQLRMSNIELFNADVENFKKKWKNPVVSEFFNFRVKILELQFFFEKNLVLIVFLKNFNVFKKY